MLETEVSVRFAQIWTAKTPAISSAPLLAENIFVKKQPPILKTVFTAVPNQIGLLLGNGLPGAGEQIPPYLVSVFLSRDEPERVCDDWSRETYAWAKSRGYGQHVNARWSHEEVNGGGRPVILNLSLQDLIGSAKILNTALVNSDVSTQLVLFGFLHDSKLFAARTYLVTAFPDLNQRNYEQSCGYTWR